ncbi:MAG TPA: hypothetical protein VFU41_03825 [Gemmatimonadales bacterium]|nr:hypothetical protein [Gemmatimonadales bacterium]
MPGELISRDALERIIQRAAELQASERDIGEGLTKEELLTLGQDVGIPPRYLQQALLEEQTRTVVEEGRGALAWLTGPARLSVQRVVQGERGAVERALDGWMDREELLQVKRRYTNYTTWEPKVGAFASIQRALGARGKTFALSRATEVAGQVTQLDAGFCHVRLIADLRRPRNQRLWGAAVLAGFGAASAAAAPVLGVLALWAFAPAVAGLALAIGVARRHRPENERIQVGLEQVLDRLERGEIKPEHALPGPRASPLVRLADEIRTLINPGAPPRG